MKLFMPTGRDFTPETDGVLFFAQRLDEMLFNYTIDLYKVPVKNTHLLFLEYLSVMKDDEIDNKYLSSILDEIVDSLNRDVVVKKYWGSDNVTKTIDTLRSLSEQAKPTLVEYLNHVFGETHYFAWCCDYTKWIVQQHNQKEKIEQALRCLIPELIWRGYSPESIFHYNRKCILKSSDPSIDVFLERFDEKERKYDVYIAVEETILSFQNLLSQRMDVNFEDDGNFSKYKHDPDLVVLHLSDIEALDDSQAAIKAFNRINLFLQFYTAVDNKAQPKFAPKAMVIEAEKTEPAFLSFATNEYSVIEGMQVEEAGQYTETLITNLITHAKCSLKQLMKAIELHNNSLKSTNFNSSFLSLWSTLEVLSLKEVGKNDLEQVLGTLLPVLQTSFFKTSISDFAKKIKDALGEKRYNDFLGKISDGQTELEKIAHFLFLNQYSELRDEYLNLLTQYPVLRYRIHYYSELSKSKKNVWSAIDKYRERVEWHISRMYRTRNTLVHSGQEPRNIRHLGEHLHYYVDLLMMESFEKLSSGVQFCTLDNVLIDSLLTCEVFKKQLSKKEPIEAADIMLLLHPTFAKQDKFEYICDCDA